jgi:hypothetical protein
MAGIKRVPKSEKLSYLEVFPSKRVGSGVMKEYIPNILQ